MTMLHALIAQVQTAPDDDAPRLAGANTVGGERGELVLVQLRIASGVATKRDEWRRLRARVARRTSKRWSATAIRKPDGDDFDEAAARVEAVVDVPAGAQKQAPNLVAESAARIDNP